MRGFGWMWLCSGVGCLPPTSSTGSSTATPPLTTTPPTSTPTEPPGPTLVVEAFPAGPSETRQDVLFVVQTSPGSADLQQAMADSFPFFMDYFLGSGLDYHIGLVTADLDDPAQRGKLIEAGGVRYIDADSPSPIELFAAMAAAGDTGSPVVQPLGAVYLALEVERDLANAGFYRDDASLHVVIVGDGTDVTGPPWLDPVLFAPWFTALKTGGEPADVSCLLGVGAIGVDCAATAALVGSGVVVDIGDASALEQLGFHAVDLPVEFFLASMPVVETIEVAVEASGVSLQFTDADWVYDPIANSVRFLAYVPGTGATVLVTYEESVP